MKKFLSVIVSVGAFVILIGAAVAQMEHGSGHNMEGTKGQMNKGGQHEMMKNHMSKGGHAMKGQMSKAGHEMMKNHMGQTGHDTKNQAGEAGHESHGGKDGR
jgi:hypothetical protein